MCWPFNLHQRCGITVTPVAFRRDARRQERHGHGSRDWIHLQPQEQRDAEQVGRCGSRVLARYGRGPLAWQHGSSAVAERAGQPTPGPFVTNWSALRPIMCVTVQPASSPPQHRMAVHMDCMHWVNRDSYLPQGSRGLKVRGGLPLLLLWLNECSAAASAPLPPCCHACCCC